MKTLFEKIEAVKINAVCVLCEEDKMYCNGLFATYKKHHDFFIQLYSYTKQQYTEHEKNTDGNKMFAYAISDIHKVIEQLYNINAALTETFILQTENYFKEKYHLDFTHYSIESNEQQQLAVLENYEPVIANMIQQVGADLMQSGRDKAMADFQNCFSSLRKQPVLKNSKVQLPHFFYAATRFNGENYIEYSDKDIKNLLYALALFLWDNTVITPEMQTAFDDWKNLIDFNMTYRLPESITIKFYKNGRLDIGFSDVPTAERFFQTFQLETK